MADGHRRTLPVHRLIAETFCGPKPTPDHQVRHLNGDKADNRASNLAWGLAKENADDREVHGMTARGERNGFSRLTEAQVRQIRALAAQDVGLREIGRAFGVTKENIRLIVLRKAWKHVA